METRIEKDLLGEREVPRDAYYGVQTVRAMENFPITGRCPHEQLIKGVIYVKQATALANRSWAVCRMSRQKPLSRPPKRCCRDVL